VDFCGCGLATRPFETTMRRDLVLLSRRRALMGRGVVWTQRIRKQLDVCELVEIGAEKVRMTVFRLVDGQVRPESSEAAPWTGPDEFGQMKAEVHQSPNGTTVLYRILSGSVVPMHASRKFASCQIMTGRGKLTLPDGPGIEYCGPELFIFEPGSLHGWEIAEDTVGTACEVTDVR
jgi:quercetin dioxygenase-like cupin family protein